MSAEQVLPDDDGPKAPARAGMADERFAANLRANRERAGMSQAALAEKMAALGHPWYPQTVHRVETGTRKVSVGEASELARLVGSTVDRLTWPGQEESAAWILGEFAARARQATGKITDGTVTLEHCRRQLAATLGQAERAGWLGSPEIRRLAEEAREAMSLQACDAVAAGLEQYREMTGGDPR